MGRKRGGEVEYVAEQHQLAVVLAGDPCAHFGETPSLVLVAEHAREGALAEMQVADHIERHSMKFIRASAGAGEVSTLPAGGVPPARGRPVAPACRHVVRHATR